MGAATTIVNAKVFDGTKSRDWTSVRFADGLITRCSVASAAQEGDEVIDAAGGTVLPGLIDAHVHLVPGALAQSLTFGVTTVLDMFSKPGLVASAKEQAGSRPDVADVRSAGVGATAPGGHPSMMYAPFPTLAAADQAGQFVAERIAAGSDYLKIISGTGGLWPCLDPETIRALVSAAHARGLLVVAHVSSTAGVEEVVSAGVDVVAHVPADAELDEALAGRMAEAGIVVGPTLATIENTLGEPGGAAVAGDPRLAEALGDAWGVKRTRPRVPRDCMAGRCPPTPGPRTTCGDCPMRGSLCWRARMPRTRGPYSGQACTGSSSSWSGAASSRRRGPGRCQRAGSRHPRCSASPTGDDLAAGQRADLVLVSGDPLTDITATRALTPDMARGHGLRSARLRRQRCRS